MHGQTVEEKSSSSNIDHEAETPSLADHASSILVIAEKPMATGLHLPLELSRSKFHNHKDDVAHDVISSELSYTNNPSSSKEENTENTTINSPSKSEELQQCKRVGSQDPFSCPECKRGFPSLKSLYGHLRRHPERPYRGSKPPSTSSDQYLSSKSRRIDLKWLGKGKRGQNSQKVYSEMLEAAKVLMEMRNSSCPIDEAEVASKDLAITKPKAENKKKKIKVWEFVHESNSLEKKGKYQCTTCNKSFSTYQALGGHKSSHNKKKIKMKANMVERISEVGEGGHLKCAVAGPTTIDVHKCKLCSNAFATGMALGGHMRGHRITERLNDRVYDFDLNEPVYEA